MLGMSMKKVPIFRGSLVDLAKLWFTYGEYGIGSGLGSGYGDGVGYGASSVDGSGYGDRYGLGTNWALAGAEVLNE